MPRKPYRIRTGGAALLCTAGVLLLGSCGALLLGGCAAEKQVIQPGAGLSADTLRAGGMALVGITVLDEVEQVRPPLVSTFEKVLAAVRPDMPIRPASAARDALGLPAYRKLLFAYQETGRLQPEEQEALAKALGPRARYAILARVEKNTVRTSGGGLPQQGTATMGGAPTTPPPSRVSRDARIRFTIYDLAETRGVFEATYASSSDNRAALPMEAPQDRTETKRPDVQLDGPGASVDSRVPPAGDSGLESPPLSDALIEAYRTFAYDLPATPAAKSRAGADSSTAR